MRFAWHLVLTEDTNGRVRDPQRLWQILGDYANRVVGPAHSVALRFTQEPTLSAQPFLAAVNALALVEDARACEREGIDGIVMAASIDPAVDEARSMCRIPVVGSIESALALSAFVGRKAGIVTIAGAGSTQAYANLIEANATRYGCRERLITHRPVRPLPMSWQAFYACYSKAVDGDGDELVERFDTLATGLVEDGADVIICGNQLFGGVLENSGYRFVTPQGAPVIDNVAAALKMLEALRSLQLQTGLSRSEIGPFRSLPEASLDVASTALRRLGLVHRRASSA